MVVVGSWELWRREEEEEHSARQWGWIVLLPSFLLHDVCEDPGQARCSFQVDAPAS